VRPANPAPSALNLPAAAAPKIADLGGSTLLKSVQRRSAEVEAAGETLSEQQAQLADLRVDLSVRVELLAKLDEKLTELQRVADEWARGAYMSSQSELARTPALTSVIPPSDSLERARSDVEDARLAYSTDAEVERAFAAQVAGNHAKFTGAIAQLTDLRTRHAAQLAAEQKVLDERRMQVGNELLAGFGDASAQGLIPGPAAIRAVNFALAQRGKPYEWGAEGLATYDCSGLVQRAYGEAGVRLPRTARPQWRATTAVSPANMIAGDLLFFATDASNWNSIHHVGIYLGGGKMLHAPTTGDYVRIAPVWWEEFFGATRVVPAVPAPNKPAPRPKPRPEPKPTPTRSPSPTPTTPAPTTPSPTQTPTPVTPVTPVTPPVVGRAPATPLVLPPGLPLRRPGSPLGVVK
jgi:cell wall-associated NlpC family hydrolase